MRGKAHEVLAYESRLVSADTSETKPKTLVAKNEVAAMECGQRPIVMNKRTGQVASAAHGQKAPFHELHRWPSVVSSEGGDTLPGTRRTKVGAWLHDPLAFLKHAQRQLDWDLKQRSRGYLLFSKNEEWKSRRLSATVLPQYPLGAWRFQGLEVELARVVCTPLGGVPMRWRTAGLAPRIRRP